MSAPTPPRPQGCEEIQGDLAAWAAEALPEDRRSRLTAHLAACDACRERTAAAEPSSLFLQLRGGPLPDGFWSGFEAGLRARLGAPRPSGPSSLFRYPRLAYLTAPLAMILILGATALIVRPPRFGRWSGKPPGAVRSPYDVPSGMTAPAGPGNVRRRIPVTPGSAGTAPIDPPVLEEVGSPGARVYRFTVGAPGDETPIYLVVDESLDI